MDRRGEVMRRMNDLSLERFERIAELSLKLVDFDDIDQLRMHLLELAGVYVNAMRIAAVKVGPRFVCCEAWNEREHWRLRWRREGNHLGEYWAYKVVGSS
jgi:hypothetical protein